MGSKQLVQFQTMFEPVVNSLGFELWGVEYLSQGRHSTLRLYIESNEGVTVEDCARVSHQVSAILEVEEPVSGEYFLEVSSPGMDRVLFTVAHYKAYEGQAIQVKLLAPISGRRRFTGVLQSAGDESLKFEIDGESIDVPFSQIEKGRVLPQYDF